MQPGRVVTSLARACHPLPTLAVTLFAVALAVSAGQPPRTVLTVGLAVLTGQLSVGWSNDARDAAADRASGRRDKPTVAGLVAPRTLWAAAGTAAVACAALSLSVGVVAGAAHLVGVAAGWLYNLGLKRTVASVVPYAVAFGLLPVFVLLADPRRVLPGADVVVAAALLGAGAHFANTAPDIADDVALGVRGLPHRLGERRSVLVTSGLVAVAAAVLALGPSRPGPAGLVVLGVGAAAAVAVGRVRVAWAFPLTLGAVALVLAGFLAP